MCTRAATHSQAIVGGSLASLAAAAGMLLLRSVLQVRSLPERLMEWLLLFMPPTLFEAALQQFGFDAKRYALNVSIAVVLVLIAGLGYTALRRGWRMSALASVGLSFWLFVMLVIMPLTSAGIFATALPGGTAAAAIFGYLAVGLSQAAVLSACRAVLLARAACPVCPRCAPRILLRTDQTTAVPRRRTVLGLLGATAAAYVGAYLTGAFLPVSRSAPLTRITDPQEPFLSGGIEPPNPHPRSVVGNSRGPPPGTASPSLSSAMLALPEPAVTRTLVRDKDGAVLSSGRPKGVLTSALTSNTDFYVVTKNAALDPVVHPQDWRLLVDGDVERSVELDYATLRSLRSVEVIRTLECVSNFVGKPQLAPFGAELISTAVWKGVRISDVLARAGGARPGVGWVAVLGADEFTTALPLAAVLAPDSVLVYEMNGDVLPREHGYPVRLLVPGRYGMKSSKWVVGLRLVRGEFLDWYGQRNWSRDGVVRTMSRIDAPVDGAVLEAGVQHIAGIAFAGSRGVAQVEYSADGGETWRLAELLDPPSSDQWIRWQGDFRLEARERLKLVARATDGVGNLQVEAFSLPEPDGGTGWQSVDVQAS